MAEESARSKRTRRERRRCWRWAVATAGALVLATLPLGGGRGREAWKPQGLRRAAPRWAWIPREESGRGGVDARAVVSPAVFALPTPAGFTHALRVERVELEPSLSMSWTEAGCGEPADGHGRRHGGERTEISEGGHAERWGAGGGQEGGEAPRSVWSEVGRVTDLAEMALPPGWETRMFQGVESGYEGWGGARGWTAGVDVTFGEDGIPRAAVVSQSSGDEALDQRLARSVRGWRMREPEAVERRQGVVTWTVPRAAAVRAREEEGKAE